jgi:hypothetical protein
MLRPNLPRAVSLMSSRVPRELSLLYYPETHVAGGIFVTTSLLQSLRSLLALSVLRRIVVAAMQFRPSEGGVA